MSAAPKFTKGETVKVYMGFTTTGVYAGKEGDKHMIDIDDDQCGAGRFGFPKWDDVRQMFTV